MVVALNLLIATAPLFVLVPRAEALSGSGTVGDPYQITNQTDLASLSSFLGSGNSSKYFKVMNDIALSGNWTPIGNGSNGFYAKLDGNNKTISGLSISSTGGQYLGLFGLISAGGQVTNLKVTGASVTVTSPQTFTYIGVLVGQSAGTLSGVYTSGSVSGGNHYSGGIAGINNGTISNSYSSTSVSGANYAGGITGYTSGAISGVYSTGTVTCGNLNGGIAGMEAGGTISNSFSRSTIAGSNWAGGLVGYLSGGSMTNSYYAGAFTGSSSSGGAVGQNSGTVSGVYWDTEVSGKATSAAGTGKTTAEMKTQSTYSGWDFSTIWNIDGSATINNGYPYQQWVVTNNPPNAPASLGSSAVTSGSAASTQPSFSFSLSDPDGSDTVKYQIQIDDSSNFASPVVDYTSALAAQGSRSFSVGQAAGSGSYAVGSSGQSLSDASYYWRVKAIDNNGGASSYSVANSGSVAFIVDTIAPTAPGVPSGASPTNDTTPTISWTASSDANANGSNPTYQLELSQDSNFSSGILAYITAATNTFTIISPLSDGLWYMRVKGYDIAFNASSYSSTGSITIDTTAPSIPDAPSLTSPTNSVHPTVTWTAPAEAADYILQWSSSSSFASSSSTNVSATSYTVPLSLAEGSWYFRVAARDALGNTSDFSDIASTVIDTTAPNLQSLAPANNATLVNRNSSLAISFDEPVHAAAGNITIYRAGDNSVVQTIAANSSAVSGSGTSSLIITPSAPLAYETAYYVRVASDAVTDLAGNAFSGITGSSWYFSTESQPPAPAITSTAKKASPTPTPSPSPAASASPSVSPSPSPVTTGSGSSTKVLLNDYPEYSLAGKEVTMQPAQVVWFHVDEEQHSATIKQVGTNFALITIASTPRDVSINLGERKQYDVNDDGVNDLEIYLAGISNGKANLIFKQLAQPAAIKQPNAKLIIGASGLLLVLLLAGVLLKKANRQSH